MASQTLPNKDFLALIVMVLAILPIALAETFIVGGNQGWRTGVDFEVWARDKVFRVGDKLVFKYERCFHSVVRVLTEEEFQNCVVPTGDNVQQLTSGYDIVPLVSEGRKFFTCGVGRNCVDSCQKLAIVVRPHNG
ncbi:Blue copper protein 1a [Linum grandiflorum]